MDPLHIGVIGLGVMGQRMLARLADHPRLRATHVWDADASAMARTLQAHPGLGLQAADSAQALIAAPGLHSLYIATPPAPHMALSNLAFDAGLAVLCEKPLTVDFDAARQTIARIQAQGLRAAVNFSLASSPGLAVLQQAWQQQPGGLLGRALSAQVELAFAAWPRPWQAAAGAWLAQRAEGGFTREVLSHFIFVLQRVLGPARVLQAQPVYPADGLGAETALQARLEAGGIPIEIAARIGGEVDDHNRLLLRGSQGEIELREWFGVQQRRHGDAAATTPDDAATLRSRGQADQLTQWVALIEGRPHGLPGFAEALAVQQTIEALLAGA
ncbi:MAG: Gfo/Idh/MocA family oxidoreductase [Burkholderiaceae bacterium]|nr:Gfo/Idh/MocA family oxidoreductase [Burkholderiaceae bacterium]